jgi:hypothetical protein
MTLGECKALLAIAGRNYDKPIPKGLAEDWHEAMKDIPEHLGMAALRAHLKSREFFPTIAAIRAAAAEEAEPPPVLYVPPAVVDPVPREEIRELVTRTVAKLCGERSAVSDGQHTRRGAR